MSSVVKAFQPSGIFDGIQGNQLRIEITSAVETGVDIVLLDLQDITFMNSAGLGTLLAALKAARKIGGKISLCSVNEQVQLLLRMTKMERIFEIFNNRDEFERAIIPPEYRLLEHH